MMTKMPRLLPGYGWDVDRTSDVLTVGVWHHDRQIEWACVVVNSTVRFHLLALFVRALWKEWVWNRLTDWLASIRLAAQVRSERVRAARQSQAASLDGIWWNGKRAPRPIEPLADWERELLAASVSPGSLPMGNQPQEES